MIKKVSLYLQNFYFVFLGIDISYLQLLKLIFQVRIAILTIGWEVLISFDRGKKS